MTLWLISIALFVVVLVLVCFALVWLLCALGTPHKYNMYKKTTAVLKA
jgi:hypothetical protein